MTDEKSNYKINIGNGYINVEAPTKKECISLYRTVTKTPIKRPIDEALR